MRIFKTLLATSVLTGALAFAAGAAELHVLNWKGYGADEPWAVEAFEKATGHKVVNDFFNSEQEMLTKLRTNPGLYDVVMINAAFNDQAFNEKLIQPIDVSKASPGFPHARSGLACTQGARVIDSTPPATSASASPARTACAASAIADMPEAHSRLTVMPGTSSGRPASSAARRATLRLSSPAWFAAPRMTSSTASRGSPARATASPTTSAARSSGRMPASAPP